MILNAVIEMEFRTSLRRTMDRILLLFFFADWKHLCTPVLFPRPHTCWNNETIRFKSSLTSIIIESTYLTLNMNTIWGCFKVQVGWKKCILWGNWVSKRFRKGLSETLTIKKHFLTFTLSVNKIIIYQFSMVKSLDSIASVVGIFMYLTI